MKRLGLGKPEFGAGVYPPPESGGLIEAGKIQIVECFRQFVSPARERGPH